MKTLGINISHDASICIMEDGVITEYYEENRLQRDKWWTPNSNLDWLSLEKIKDQKFDYVGMVSFDRRETNFHYGDYNDDDFDEKGFAAADKDSLPIEEKSTNAVNTYDNKQEDMASIMRHEFRWEAEKCYEDLQTELLDWERIEELQEDHSRLVVDASAYTNSEDNDWGLSNISYEDRMLCDNAAQQLGIDVYHFEQGEHHKFHVYGGYHLSDWEKTGEDALVIVQDGGGSYPLFNTYPVHQEVESIWTIGKEGVERKWTHLSNMRMTYDACEYTRANPNVYTKEIDDCDWEFSSKPSMGYLFSNVCSSLGIDEKGRSAGTVMGYATYGVYNPEIMNPAGISQLMQTKSYEYTCSLIEKALTYSDTKNIIITGGYALNCSNNIKYVQKYPELNFFIDPCAADSGTAIGMSNYLTNYKEWS
jgi:predicted NodU family carbamoyl transferase